MNDKLIVVIGAGAAGLAATHELLKYGLPVRLLEAGHCFGGRVKAVDMGLLNPLDTGAAFLHSKSLELYPCASAHQLLQPRYPARCFIDSRQLPLWLFGVVYGVPNLWRMNRMFKQFYQLDQTAATMDELIQKARFSATFGAFFHSTLSSSLGVGVDHVGVHSLRESFNKAGIRPERDLGQYALKDSLYSLIADVFSDATRCCEYNRQVIAIDYSDTPVVETRDGERIDCARVILTVPLSVLQSSGIRFRPELPEWKQNAIAKLGMGQGARIFFRLNRPFWPPGSKQIINGRQPLHITIHSDDPALISVFYVSVDGRPVDDGELHALCMQMFIRMFGNHAIKNIIEVHLENWSSNTLIGGAYSYDPPDSVGARSELSRSLSNKLFFAGEAAIEGHFATVDGAILSGQRAVNEIRMLSSDRTG